jgi:hypothetical protein
MPNPFIAERAQRASSNPKNKTLSALLKSLDLASCSLGGFYAFFIKSDPGFSLRSNHWAEISKRLRRWR